MIRSSIIEKNIKIKASLHANMEDGFLVLSLKVWNNSRNKITVDYFNCSLMIESDRGAAPEIKKTFKPSLKPGEIESYEFVYHPINSLDFYQKLDYPGDMKQKYSVKLDFLKDTSGHPISKNSITFELKNKTYQEYLDKCGKENKTHLFDFAFNRDSFVLQQRTYLEAKEPIDDSPELFVSISNSEMMMGTSVVKIIGYLRHDTLNENITILNNGPNKLKAKLDSVKVNVAGKTYLPKKISSEFFNYNQVIDNSVLIRTGDRFNVLLQYKISNKIDCYLLGTNWLFILGKDKDSKKLICHDLLMR